MTSARRVWEGLGRLDAFLSDGEVPATGRDAILMFHSVGDDAFDDVSPTVFRRLLERLSETVEFVDLPTVHRDVTEQKRIALTFDDGYAGFPEHVVPVLNDLGVPATVFVVAATLRDESLYVDDEIGEQYMTAAELRGLVDERQVTIGNHTMTHPNLETVDDGARLEREIIDAKRLLEDELDVSVDRFCYPYNNYTAVAHNLVRRSHEYAVCGGGWKRAVSIHANPYLLPRVNGAVEWWRLRWHLLDRSSRLATAADELVDLIR